MPQYLLSVWHDEPYGDFDPNDPDMQRIGPKVDALNNEMQQQGAWVFGCGLRPASSATVLRSSGGDVSMTDGPYAETKEQLGGFWVIDVPSREVALQLAAEASKVCIGKVEVRPMMEAPE